MGNSKAVIFDMDGTTLDTLEDLRIAINYALAAHGHRGDYPTEVVRLFFGSAIRVAIERALFAEQMKEPLTAEEEAAILSIGESKESDADPAEVEAILETYRPYYNAHCDDHTGPYDGIPEVLLALKNAGIKTAVVSNKPDAAVQKLVEDLFPGQFDYCLGQIDGVPRKPHPAMTEQCLAALGAEKEDAVYIGDSEVDLATAKNAQLDAIGVSWGFRGKAFLKSQGCERIADTADELLQMLM